MGLLLKTHCPAQAAGGAERLSEALLEDLSEDMAARAAEADRRFEGLALCGLPASTLESMLLRMEEIQVFIVSCCGGSCVCCFLM